MLSSGIYLLYHMSSFLYPDYLSCICHVLESSGHLLAVVLPLPVAMGHHRIMVIQLVKALKRPQPQGLRILPPALRPAHPLQALLRVVLSLKLPLIVWLAVSAKHPVFRLVSLVL